MTVPESSRVLIFERRAGKLRTDAQACAVCSIGHATCMACGKAVEMVAVCPGEHWGSSHNWGPAIGQCCHRLYMENRIPGKFDVFTLARA